MSNKFRKFLKKVSLSILFKICHFCQTFRKIKIKKKMSEEDVFQAIDEKNLSKLRDILAIDQGAITRANGVLFYFFI